MADVDEVFASQDVGKMAARIQGMQQSLVRTGHYRTVLGGEGGEWRRGRGVEGGEGSGGEGGEWRRGEGGEGGEGRGGEERCGEGQEGRRGEGTLIS